MSKKALFVIDAQNDFIDGILGTQEAVAAVPHISNLVSIAVAEGWDIFYTMDTHQADYMETQEGRNLPVPHCIFNSEGWRINRDCLPSNPGHSTTILKNRFGSTLLPQYNLNQYSEIVVCGFCSDICVINNVCIIKAFSPETPITFVASASAGVTPEKHEAAKEVMRSLQVNVVERYGD